MQDRRKIVFSLVLGGFFLTMGFVFAARSGSGVGWTQAVILTGLLTVGVMAWNDQRMVCSLAFFLLGAVLTAFLVYSSGPAPVRAFHKYEKAVDACVLAIKAGRIPEVKGRPGDYEPLDVLVPWGLHFARKTKDGCIHLVFRTPGWWYDEPTPSLVYCPEDWGDIREIAEPVGGIAIIRAEHIAYRWFYCLVD
jgi:hypothetical protein